MEIQPLPELLDELLHEASDEGLEVCLASTAVVSGSQLDTITAEYVLRFERALSAVSASRGAPVFRGTSDQPAFPHWADAAELGLWTDAAGLIYVALRGDRERLRLVAGARPHPIERETVTLLPPSE